MARGWESKSVEDQISAAEDEKSARGDTRLSSRDRERQARRQSLRLSRSRTNALLERAHNPTYRAQLERTLKHLDYELSSLDTSSENNSN